MFEVLECLQFGRRSKKFSANLRLFFLTVHFYSPKAYRYIRSFFKFHPPDIRTIRKWYSVIDGSPGFTECAFDLLKQKAEDLKAEGKILVVGLSHDDMHIRRHSQWISGEAKFLGHINAGEPVSYEKCSPLAKEANVLMVTGIGHEFKVAIGNFLSVGLRAEERAAILYEALLKLHKIGVVVASITNDGNVVNITVAKLLGVNYGANQPYFINPFNKKNKVYSILDPPHMTKLARNCLGNKETIYDNENNEIKWQYIKDLVSLQISKDVNLGNKLTKSHVEYESNKMNVLKAAQTLSISTATSLEYLCAEKEQHFIGSESTSQYCRVINNLFDIMNTKRMHLDEHFRQPMTEQNIQEIAAYFETARQYLKGLKIVENGKMKPILKSRSYTPYFGFYHNTISFMGIYNDFIKPHGINEFYTFDVSQDHLESFFGCIRQMGGIY